VSYRDYLKSGYGQQTNYTTTLLYNNNNNDRPGNHDVKELQKTAILGTAHILRRVLT